MTAPVTMVRRTGATWVHRYADDHTERVHTLCGLEMSPGRCTLIREGWSQVDCPQCLAAMLAAARTQLLAATPVHEFRPKTGEIALAWAGPHVEIVAAAGTVTVFLDGAEVPCTHVTHVDVSRDVTGDVTGSPAFLDLLAAERGATRRGA